MGESLDDRLEQLRNLGRHVIEVHGPAAAQAARSALEDGIRSATVPQGCAIGEPAATFDRTHYAEIIGESPPMLAVFALLDRVAASNIPVLIQGESGTGKELIAKAVHKNSPRRDKAFVTENCAAIPETLLESELFGYKRGAFTGADRERKGLFETAHKGTLFLDEVGDMSLNMQKKLLRALQDGEIRPVGGTAAVRVDVRIVAASNRLLRDMVKAQTFREDLFYRLNGVTIELPPLRDRTADIEPLARFFITRVAKEMGREAPELSASALAALQHYRWPGNIRELENEVRRCLALLGDAKRVEVEHFGDEVRRAASLR
ncbi:MAG: sigma 54-interacting transcriptional regulator [Planctomycetes bacterium]|nr:sigma 54-interacting transcriptional regulator [Planctomycetota bacterium]MCC7168981.1 sigma 54-interacting transcriptional regulator [Planctomycetota bacterium]